MYALDGVPLQNPGLGWRFKRESEPRVSRGLDRPDFNASNRDGTIAVRGHVTTPTMTLVVDAPGSSIETLERLMRLGTSLTRVSDPSIVLGVQAVTITPQTLTPGGPGLYRLTVVYRVPGVWWRDAATTDWSATLPTTTGAGAANMCVLTGTSGAVHDALVVVSGGIQNVRIAGRNSTWLQYGLPIFGQWVRFDTERGRCWFGSTGDGSDPWTNTGNEQTANVNSGAYPYFLELFPDSTGPAACILTVSYDKVTAPTTVTVRAKNAYDR